MIFVHPILLFLETTLESVFLTVSFTSCLLLLNKRDAKPDYPWLWPQPNKERQESLSYASFRFFSQLLEYVFLQLLEGLVFSVSSLEFIILTWSSCFFIVLHALCYSVCVSLSSWLIFDFGCWHSPFPSYSCTSFTYSESILRLNLLHRDIVSCKKWH